MSHQERTAFPCLEQPPGGFHKQDVGQSSVCEHDLALFYQSE